MNNDNDNMFGVGTDLVVSLFSMALILVGLLSGLYTSSMEEQQTQQVEITELVEQLEHCQFLNEELQQKLHKCEIENKRLEDKNRELKLEVAQLKDENEKLKIQNDILKERVEFHKELGNKVDEAKTLILDLEEQNSTLKERVRVVTTRNKLIYQQKKAIEQNYNSLKLKHEELCENSDLCGKAGKPKRTRQGKFVVIIVQNSSVRDDLKVKIDGRPYEKTTRWQLHSRLKRLQARYGETLYVGADVANDVSRGALTELICEFRKYDYYEFHDENECVGW